MIIATRSVSQEGNKHYPQVYLHECGYELQKCCSTIKLMLQKELTLLNYINQTRLWSVIIGILKTLVTNLNHAFVTIVMIYQWWLMN